MSRGIIPKTLDNALGFNLDRVATFFRQELMRALAEYDLTPEQWQIMSIVWGNRAGLSQQEITDLLAKDKHNISRMIRRLEAKGWLEREQNPEDARAFLVRATNQGEKVRPSVTQTLYAHFDHLDLGLDKDEQEKLVAMLKVIRQHLREGS
jgi:MarR family transcriptional regulator, lower aerobic nicotinate degradation pathway regulator